MDASARLEPHPLIPVLVIDSADAAVPLARHLLRAGIGVMEITLRTPAALAAMETVLAEVPQMCVGVGSIRSAEDIERVQAGGAHFGVSPGATGRLLDAASDFPLVPGAATASESLALMERGYRLLKFFPAEANGGSTALRALAAPLPELRYCPTGGVGPNNVQDYLDCPNVASIGGSWFVPRSQIAEGNFEAIEQASREALQLVRRVDDQAAARRHDEP